MPMDASCFGLVVSYMCLCSVIVALNPGSMQRCTRRSAGADLPVGEATNSITLHNMKMRRTHVFMHNI